MKHELPYVVSFDEKSGAYYCHNRKTPKIPVFGSVGDKNKADAITYRIQDDWYSGYVSDHYGVIGHFVLK